jgi:hypothetical protein
MYSLGTTDSFPPGEAISFIVIRNFSSASSISFSSLGNEVFNMAAACL